MFSILLHMIDYFIFFVLNSVSSPKRLCKVFLKYNSSKWVYKLILFKNTNYTTRGHSSVVEHSNADREVTGSNPVVPLKLEEVSMGVYIHSNFL